MAYSLISVNEKEKRKIESFGMHTKFFHQKYESEINGIVNVSNVSWNCYNFKNVEKNFLKILKMNVFSRTKIDEHLAKE